VVFDLRQTKVKRTQAEACATKIGVPLFGCFASKNARLVLAAGKQGGEDAQVRVCEQPAFGMVSGGFGGAHDGAEVLAASDGVQVLGANSSQARDFIFRENLLSGLDGDHGLAFLAERAERCGSVRANVVEQSRYVSQQ